MGGGAGWGFGDVHVDSPLTYRGFPATLGQVLAKELEGAHEPKAKEKWETLPPGFNLGGDEDIGSSSAFSDLRSKL